MADFYVGYESRAPRRLAAWVRAWVLVLLLVAAGLAVSLAASQRPFAKSVFEFGTVRSFEGVLRAEPYPVLLVRRPGRHREESYSTYLLTIFGKHGATAEVQGFDGKAVSLEGELIYRDGQTMIQLVSGSVRPIVESPRADPTAPALPAVEELGSVELVGEIVDSKCFLGVMKPGHLKPHRACAARCISGGIPPLLLVRGESGLASYYLLVSHRGEPVNQEVLPLVAEPVQVRGALSRHGDVQVLRIAPDGLRRLD